MIKVAALARQVGSDKKKVAAGSKPSGKAAKAFALKDGESKPVEDVRAVEAVVQPVAEPAVEPFAENAAKEISGENGEVFAPSVGAASAKNGPVKLPEGVADRRSYLGQSNPIYRVLKSLTRTFGVLALAALVGILVISTSGQSLDGPGYLALININIILIFILVLYTIRKLLVMFLDRRGRLRNAKLHLRLLGIFGILAVVPTVVIMLLSVFLLNEGIEGWFSNKVTAALDGSQQVAEAYLDEHERGLIAATEAMSREPFWREPFRMGVGARFGTLMDQESIQDWLLRRADQNRIDELVVLDETGTIQTVAEGMGSIVLPPEAMQMIRVGQDHIESFKNVAENRVTVVAPLPGRLWLVAQRWVNPIVVSRVDQTNAAYKEYEDLSQQRVKIRWIVTLFLVFMTIGALAGAIWVGIRLANQIVRPVTALVQATNRVSAGDLAARVQVEGGDEIGILAGSFNRMAIQLQNNRELLEKKNAELDERRRQMEAVLTGVTAGVVSLDAYGAIRWANPPAYALFSLKPGGLLEKSSAELHHLFQEFMAKPRAIMQQELKVCLADGSTRSLLVRLVPQYAEGGRVANVVMTFDDISPLITAQRLAAWRDVARRLAHEIKNPLTPIQLSAERLRRKYLDKMPDEDKDLFKQLTETIVRQAEDMRKMTNEFSDFARMPTSAKQEENLVELVEDVVILQRSGRGHDIEFETEFLVDKNDAILFGDRSQINRVLVNVIENAVNAVEERDEPEGALSPTARGKSRQAEVHTATGEAHGDPEMTKNGASLTESGQKNGNMLHKGHIKVVVRKSQPDMLHVDVLDNGRGLPADVETEHLFDPYVTTRKRGTGLGLAIVRRVMDEHNGDVMLRRRPEGGTAVELVFPQGLNSDKSDSVGLV